jgi:hypothetical protein
MTRDEMIAEIQRRTAFPFDFASAADDEIREFLADMTAAGDPDDRFSVDAPVEIGRRTTVVR